MNHFVWETPLENRGGREVRAVCKEDFNKFSVKAGPYKHNSVLTVSHQFKLSKWSHYRFWEFWITIYDEF